jgi:hypothetical protein
MEAGIETENLCFPVYSMLANIARSNLSFEQVVLIIYEYSQYAM